MDQNLEMVVFEIICHAGNARGCIHEALKKAENGDYVGAEISMKEADEALLQAHRIQTGMIQAEASGEKVELSMLFVHAQDHLMTAVESRGLVEHIIKLHKKIDNK